MSYLQYNDYYNQMKSMAPYPYYYPYVSNAPNLSNQNCNKPVISNNQLRSFAPCRSDPPRYFTNRLTDPSKIYQSLFGLSTKNNITNPIDQSYYNYDAVLSTNECHSSDHNQFNNVSYNERDPANAKYDYYCYDNMIQIPVDVQTSCCYQDPSATMDFTVQKLVTNLRSTYAKLFERSNILPDAELSSFPRNQKLVREISPREAKYIDQSIAAGYVSLENRTAIHQLNLSLREQGVSLENRCAKHFDMNLLDPWGIVLVNDTVWVANAGTGLIIVYNLIGKPLCTMINVFGSSSNIAEPTGIDHNSNLDAFFIVKGSISYSSTILVATRNGTISGYNFELDPDNSILVIDKTANNSVYTGLAIVNTSIKNKINSTLYVTDFYNQHIDVFDSKFNSITTYPFIDQYSSDPIPSDFAPFNIVNIGDFLYVTYAKQNPSDNQYALPGKSNGFVSIFTPTGDFVKRFASRGTLNVPWGIVLAPSWFGYPAGSLLISNFGDGTINVFDGQGKYLGNMKDKSYNDLNMEGIRGLALNPNYNKILYWTSSANNLRDAYMGTINTRMS